jgi:hypothetical protein
MVKGLQSSLYVLPFILLLLARPVAAYGSCATGFNLVGGDCVAYSVNTQSGTPCAGATYQ